MKTVLLAVLLSAAISKAQTYQDYLSALKTNNHDLIVEVEIETNTTPRLLWMSTTTEAWMTNGVVTYISRTPSAVITVLETNWLPITVKEPLGNGTMRDVSKELGVIVSNRIMTVYADGLTNKFTLSSKVHLPPFGQVWMRDSPTIFIGGVSTNSNGWMKQGIIYPIGPAFQ